MVTSYRCKILVVFAPCTTPTKGSTAMGGKGDVFDHHKGTRQCVLFEALNRFGVWFTGKAKGQPKLILFIPYFDIPISILSRTVNLFEGWLRGKPVFDQK